MNDKNTDYSDPDAKNEMNFLKMYQDKGYTINFRVENGKLIGNKDYIYSSEDVSIVAEHRYEGMSNPSDMSILYVIEADKDHKGTIINSYGPTADLEIHEFIDAIPEENVGHDDSILNLK